MKQLHLVDACKAQHFRDMSLLHALGWRAAYRSSIPADYMAREITDSRWVPVFRRNYEEGVYHGLLLYDGDTPLCCATYGPARVDQSAGDTVCNFSSPDLAAWGELVSLYSHPDHWGEGCGSIVIEEILRRLSAAGYPGCFLYVLRENDRARRFYEKHGFVWDGHALNVALTPDTTLSDLRYRKEFSRMIIENETICLEQAAASHQTEAERMKQEFFDFGETIINGSALFDQMLFPEWLVNTNRNHDPNTVRKDWAVATTFFAFRKSDRKMVGMIDVRHELAVPFLQKYGGHIGYSVRPTERKKGYATEMLRLALSYCQSLHINTVKLGCYADNIASIRTIERCGGICVEKKLYTDGRPMLVYQIDLQCKKQDS